MRKEIVDHQRKQLINSLNNKTRIFGTVALISPMKNIHLVLEALCSINSDLESARENSHTRASILARNSLDTGVRIPQNNLSSGLVNNRERRDRG